VSELGRELHGRIAKLSGLLATLGTRLNSAVKAYNETVGSYEARVIPAARRLEEHGAASSGRELPELEQVTVTARRVEPVEDTVELPGDERPAVEQLTMRRLRAAD
jgi:DNA recombination protein RmuC